jgi:hypothetical protein
MVMYLTKKSVARKGNVLDYWHFHFSESGLCWNSIRMSLLRVITTISRT